MAHTTHYGALAPPNTLYEAHPASDCPEKRPAAIRTLFRSLVENPLCFPPKPGAPSIVI